MANFVRRMFIVPAVQTPKILFMGRAAMTYVAYGVEPDRRATYELRQSRYQAIGESVAEEVRRRGASKANKLCLLDIGVYDGVSRRYIEAYPEAQAIDFEAVDIYPKGVEFVYKHEDWKHHECDLHAGLQGLPSSQYDIVICEQVLEHLYQVQPAIHDMVRVLKPGGLLIVGVPIFPEGVQYLRRHLVPVMDRLLKVKKVRGHVQAWSLRTFRREWKNCASVRFETARGFRIISGGILRPLEFTKSWWKLNRTVGAMVPGLCTEVQLLGRKVA